MIRNIKNAQTSDSLYAALFTNNHSNMLLINPDNGAIVDANEAACHFYGYNRTELLNMNLDQINTLSRKQILQEMDRAKNEERRHFYFEHRLVSGEIRSVEVFSGPVVINDKQLLYSIVFDITDKRKAEAEIINLNKSLEIKVQARTQQYQKANEQLAKTNARLEEEISERMKIEHTFTKSMKEISDLYDNAPCGYHSLDQNGRIIRINQTELTWLGYSKEEVIGKKFADFLTPASKENYLKNFRNFLENGWVKDLEVTIRHRNGAGRPILLSATAVCDENGAYVMSRSTLYDMSLKKQAEDRLIRLNNDLEEIVAGRTAHLEEIHLSHEIRTPMTGVMGILQLLQMSDLNEEQSHLIQVCMTSSELLLKVINDILDYSKIEDGNLELERVEFNLYELISNLEMLFSPAALNKSLKLATHIEDTVPEILIGDPFKLRRILSNLLGNALKFTPKGRIDLTIRKIPDNDCQNIKLEFSIKDTGIGITQDKINGLFKSFTQSDSFMTRKYGGTGLGLAICKGLIQKMKGGIWVESKENEGSTFYFTCSLEEPELDADDRKNKICDSQNRDEKKPLRILMVEDDEIIRLVIEKFSERKGWQVVAAEDGYAAIDIYQKQEFDVIIMDCHMPGLDGYKTTEEIRKIESRRGARTPIIAMTANALKGVRETCLNAGMDDYLTKPVEAGVFYATVEKWGTRA